ncbi:MAG: Ig-like domain-containing protein [Candidatus Heimdallarchaeaceae archaeon]
MRKLKSFVICLVTVTIFYLLITQSHTLAWSNGGKSTSESDPDYGTHDQIAKYAVIYVKENYPDLVSWIEEDMNEYLYWTEVPDMVYQDWVNHNYDFGDFGYKGGPPDRGAPNAVQCCYDWVVGNLSFWMNEGQPQNSEYTSNARKSLGLLAHYLGDVANPMHTDDDASDSGKEHETYQGRVGSYSYRMSYHSCHEKATTRAWEAYEYEFNAIRPDVTTGLYNGSAHDETIWVAEFANMGSDRTGRTIGYEGQDVGDHYQEFLEEIVYGFDNKIVTTHHGIDVEGTTNQLYQWNVEVLQLVTTSLAKIIYTATNEAGGGVDTTSPSVSITQPTDDSTVSGTITITAEADDNIGVAQVDFYIDGSLVGSDTSSPYEYVWDTTTVEDGTHVIKAVVIDTSGNTNYDEISVNVDNSGSSEPTNKMHVESISFEYTLEHGRYPNRILECFILILDENGNAVVDAEVTIEWTFPDGSTTIMTAITDSNGVAYFKNEYCDEGTHTVTVQDVTKTDWSYDSVSNVETSDSITI